ncbi:hypothetical protein [Spiroplasma endosymbiont of Dioctria linearis]|uniref:hypothetical protein n=1 Tax=Spiroplasma endosymbiont of Dioctria linearis TaxID=3066290 RepID=UPI00313F3084
MKGLILNAIKQEQLKLIKEFGKLLADTYEKPEKSNFCKVTWVLKKDILLMMFLVNQ